MGDDDDKPVVITCVDRHEGVVTPNPGMRAWLPDNAKRIGEGDPNCPPGMAYYGDESTWSFELDRAAPCDAFMREYPGTWKLTLRERVKGAWRGMVNGWRWP